MNTNDLRFYYKDFDKFYENIDLYECIKFLSSDESTEFYTFIIALPTQNITFCNHILPVSHNRSWIDKKLIKKKGQHNDIRDYKLKLKNNNIEKFCSLQNFMSGKYIFLQSLEDALTKFKIDDKFINTEMISFLSILDNKLNEGLITNFYLYQKLDEIEKSYTIWGEVIFSQLEKYDERYKSNINQKIINNINNINDQYLYLFFLKSKLDFYKLKNEYNNITIKNLFKNALLDINKYGDFIDLIIITLMSKYIMTVYFNSLTINEDEYNQIFLPLDKYIKENILKVYYQEKFETDKFMNIKNLFVKNLQNIVEKNNVEDSYIYAKIIGYYISYEKQQYMYYNKNYSFFSIYSSTPLKTGEHPLVEMKWSTKKIIKMLKLVKEPYKKYKNKNLSCNLYMVAYSKNILLICGPSWILDVLYIIYSKKDDYLTQIYNDSFEEISKIENFFILV